MRMLLKTSLKGIGAFLLMTMIAGFAQAQVSGGAFNGFKQNNKDPIQIEADELEVLDAKSTAIYKGNVKIRQGASLITTSRLDVIYDKDGDGGQGDIKQLNLSGGLVATSKGNTAQADKGVFYVKSEDIVLEGSVVVSQGKNIAKGCRLEANLKTNLAKIKSCRSAGSKKKGRVTTVFIPGSQKKKN